MLWRSIIISILLGFLLVTWDLFYVDDDVIIEEAPETTVTEEVTMSEAEVISKEEYETYFTTRPGNIYYAIVDVDDSLLIRSTPFIEKNNIIGRLHFSDRVGIVNEVDGFPGWYELDTGGFVSKDYINDVFIDEDIGIYSTVLNQRSGMSSSMINSYYADSPYSNLGIAFIFSEQKYNVNALFSIAVSILESDGGTSDIAVFKNNIFGYMAYDSNPFENAKSYPNKQSSINDFAKLIKYKYFNEGIYTIEDIGAKYASDPEWSNKVSRIMNDLLKDIPNK